MDANRVNHLIFNQINISGITQTNITGMPCGCLQDVGVTVCEIVLGLHTWWNSD